MLYVDSLSSLSLREGGGGDQRKRGERWREAGQEMPNQRDQYGFYRDFIANTIESVRGPEGPDLAVCLPVSLAHAYATRTLVYGSHMWCAPLTPRAAYRTGTSSPHAAVARGTPNLFLLELRRRKELCQHVIGS